MLSLIASFIIAVLSGLGVGSGGLFVIWLTLAEGTEQIAAQGLNLLFFLFSAGASLIFHIARRRILWGAVLYLTLIGIAGSLFGSFLAGLIPSAVMKKLFGAMLAILGIFSLFGKKGSKKPASS